ncbi:MAG: hypothetical protein IPK83_19560 [Planctomycetes bacterium]|nr:hypothetical protein [Planctomycetota bacterium]
MIQVWKLRHFGKLSLLGCGLIVVFAAAASGPREEAGETTVIVVRHAEKEVALGIIRL